METQPDIAQILQTTPQLCELLRVVAELRLPQGCIAAGMVRNAVWDMLHGRAPSLHLSSDVDVVYFDAAGCDPQRDAELEEVLRERRPDTTWQVRNQARMHQRNGDPPYLSVRDALRYFPETATAVAARWDDGHVSVDAPLGVRDLFALVVRPTDNFMHKLELYRARIASKDWAERWPLLRFVT